jgi:alanyl-tRNA synthetase
MLLARHRLRLRLARFSMSADHRDASSWTSSSVRTEFFNFFRSKDHSFVPSSSTIPYEDPTLLFANAGMNQVRPLFRNLLILYDSLASSNLFFSAMSILTPNCQS